METLELKALIKESMREVLREERLMLCHLLVPAMSDEEQAEIEAELGSPSADQSDDLIDMTHWVRNGGKIPKTSS